MTFAVGSLARGARRKLRAALRVWRRPRISVAVLAAGLAAYLASRLLPLLPLHADLTYGSGPGALLSRVLSRATGLLPLSLAELGVICYVAWVGVLLHDALRAGVTRRRTPGSLLRAGAARAARHAGAYLTGFYLLWGMNYARPPLAAQAAWPTPSAADVQELLWLTESATLALNTAYVELHGSDDIGQPTPMPHMSSLQDALHRGWMRSATLLPLPRAATQRYGPVKQPLLSPLITRLGLAGIYVPFTAEANVVYDLPALRKPMTVAHEQAHQRGIARESDANFVAFMVTAHSDDPLLRYSAAYFALQQLYGRLTWIVPPSRLVELRALRVRGVQRDIAHLQDYYQRTAGIADYVGSGVNGFFLNMNGIEGGTADYSRSVFLLIEWARRHGGRLLPEPGAVAAGF